MLPLTYLEELYEEREQIAAEAAENARKIEVAEMQAALAKREAAS